MTDRLIRITTALAVVAVTIVAAIISYQHAYELVRSHGESGVTARLLPFIYEAQQLIPRLKGQGLTAAPSERDDAGQTVGCCCVRDVRSVRCWVKVR